MEKERGAGVQITSLAEDVRLAYDCFRISPAPLHAPDPAASKDSRTVIGPIISSGPGKPVDPSSSKCLTLHGHSLSASADLRATLKLLLLSFGLLSFLPVCRSHCLPKWTRLVFVSVSL